MTRTLVISAKKYEDHDDCLTAARNDVAQDYGLNGWDLSPRWEDDRSRENILVDIPDGAKRVICSCGCGEWMGDACPWKGPKSETVVVEYMPECFRASHQAAGNSGSYPHNGAILVRVAKSCAKEIVEAEPEWASIVPPFPIPVRRNYGSAS